MGVIDSNIVILTKSRKLSAYCVAGIDIISGEFIRLCSNNPNNAGALQEHQCIDCHGKTITPLDIISATRLCHIPDKAQVENYQVTSIRPFDIIGKMGIESAYSLLKDKIICNAFGNKRAYLTAEEFERADHSLEVAKYQDATILDCGNKRKIDFVMNGELYRYYSVTDPIYERHRGRIADGYIVLSIPSHPFYINGENRYYKFAAAIYPME